MTPSGPLNVSALTERDGSVMARRVPMLGWIRRLSQVAEYVVLCTEYKAMAADPYTE